MSHLMWDICLQICHKRGQILYGIPVCTYATRYLVKYETDVMWYICLHIYTYMPKDASQLYVVYLFADIYIYAKRCQPNICGITVCRSTPDQWTAQPGVTS